MLAISNISFTSNDILENNESLLKITFLILVPRKVMTSAKSWPINIFLGYYGRAQFLLQSTKFEEKIQELRFMCGMSPIGHPVCLRSTEIPISFIIKYLLVQKWMHNWRIWQGNLIVKVKFNDRLNSKL